MNIVQRYFRCRPCMSRPDNQHGIPAGAARCMPGPTSWPSRRAPACGHPGRAGTAQQPLTHEKAMRRLRRGSAASAADATRARLRSMADGELARSADHARCRQRRSACLPVALAPRAGPRSLPVPSQAALLVRTQGCRLAQPTAVSIMTARDSGTNRLILCDARAAGADLASGRTRARGVTSPRTQDPQASMIETPPAPWISSIRTARSAVTPILPVAGLPTFPGAMRRRQRRSGTLRIGTRCAAGRAGRGASPAQLSPRIRVMRSRALDVRPRRERV